MNDQKQKTKEPVSYLTIPEAAEHLRVCPKTLYALCHLPDFPAVKIGNKWSISRERLDPWWETQWESKEGYFKR